MQRYLTILRPKSRMRGVMFHLPTIIRRVSLNLSNMRIGVRAAAVEII